jgi:SAM-dependent methyltransferase
MNENTSLESLWAPPGSGAEGVPDPTDWEGRYRVGDTPWDKGRPAPPLTDFLARRPILGDVLVPGCGPGHDVRAIAKQGARVTGLDLSPTGIAVARSHSPAGNERYEQGDLFIPPGEWRESFDWVVEHTCFCAIQPARRADYAEAVFRVLKPGGLYLGIFYMDPDHPEGPPYGSTPGEIAGLFDPYSDLLEEWMPGSAFAGREGRELCQLRRKGLVL